MCLARWSERMKRRPHTLQPNFFSPVCVRLWRDSSSERENRRPHRSHWHANGFSPAQTIRTAHQVTFYSILWLRITMQQMCKVTWSAKSPGVCTHLAFFKRLDRKEQHTVETGKMVIWTNNCWVLLNGMHYWLKVWWPNYALRWFHLT